MNNASLYIPSWYFPLIATTIFVLLLVYIITRLRAWSESRTNDLMSNRHLRRYNYNIVKKQLNRLRANIPALDSMVEHSTLYEKVVCRADNFGITATGSIDVDGILTNTPVRDFIHIHLHDIPLELVSKCYDEAHELDIKYCQARVLSI